MRLGDLAVAKTEIKCWGEKDAGTMEQLGNLAELPFLVGNIASMPDAHVGYGVPIGTVFATKGAVIPNAVGVDIGCGVAATGVLLDVESFMEKRDEVLEAILAAVPVGFARRDKPLIEGICDGTDLRVVEEFKEVGATSLGTLGGGNHFIEIQSNDAHELISVMVHSGSRNLGKQVCDHYDKLARELNPYGIDPKKELCALTLESDEGQEYMAEMDFCINYAYTNRRLIMDEIRKVFREVCGADMSRNIIDCCHNYASFENGVLVHRKGAVNASNGVVLIPGSMGTSSYIAEGLNNKDSLGSCSHGAGRAMGRGKARREIDENHAKACLAERDIKVVMKDEKGFVEESPAAYKNIEDVMKAQEDLVAPLVTLSPLGVVKG